MVLPILSVRKEDIPTLLIGVVGKEVPLHLVEGVSLSLLGKSFYLTVAEICFVRQSDFSFNQHGQKLRICKVVIEI